MIVQDVVQISGNNSTRLIEQQRFSSKTFNTANTPIIKFFIYKKFNKMLFKYMKFYL